MASSEDASNDQAWSSREASCCRGGGQLSRRREGVETVPSSRKRRRSPLDHAFGESSPRTRLAQRIRSQPYAGAGGAQGARSIWLVYGASAGDVRSGVLSGPRSRSLRRSASRGVHGRVVRNRANIEIVATLER